MKKLVIYPSIDALRLRQIVDLKCPLKIVNCESLEQAEAEIGDADGFYGKMLPDLLAAARQLQWVQSPTASLEHYLFPALIQHPCQLTNMRGLFYDVIADHVFTYCLLYTSPSPRDRG